MNQNGISRLTIMLCFILLINIRAQNSVEVQMKEPGDTQKTAQEFIQSLVGSWEGTCRTWFQPGKLADESPVKGEFRLLLDGRFLRHNYEGAIQGKPRRGEETIVFNTARNKFQLTWIDDFHMNYGILFSEGEIAENGFVVAGQYFYDAGQPPWGWKTVYELTDPDHLTITAYNITPEGQEAKAVETKYRRAE